MKFQWADAEFEMKRIESRSDGFIGLELFRTGRDGQTKRVATVIYWDATGHFFLETLGTDLPLGVVDRLVAKAKTLVGG